MMDSEKYECGKHIDNLDFVIAIFIALAGILYYYSYYNRGLNLLDEGYLLDPIMRVYEGEIPYRDFHHFYTPGSFYLFAALFKLTKPDLLVIRRSWILIHVLTGILAYLAARKVSSRMFAVVVMLVILIAPGVWHKSFFVFFPVLLVWLIFKYIERPSAQLAFLAGIGVALSFLFRQDVGIYAAVSFAALAIWRKNLEERQSVFLDMRWFVAGVSLLLAPFFAYFIVKCGKSIFSDLFMAGYIGTKANWLPFPPLWPIWNGGVVNTLFDKIFYLPFVIYGTGLVLLVKYRRDIKHDLRLSKLFFAMSLGLLILLELKNRTDIAHFFQVMPLGCITAAGVLSKFAENNRRILLSVIMALLMGWIAIVGLLDPASGSIAMMKGNDYALLEKRARVFISKDNAITLKETLEYLRKNVPSNAEYVWAVPDIPMVYFLIGKKNPTKYELLRLGVSSTEESQERIVQDIKEKKVRWIVLNTNEACDNIPRRRFKVFSPTIYKYIQLNYKRIAVFGNFEVLKRGRLY